MDEFTVSVGTVCNSEKIHPHLSWLLQSSFLLNSHHCVMWEKKHGVLCTITMGDEVAQVWIPLNENGKIGDFYRHQNTENAHCWWTCSQDSIDAFNEKMKAFHAPLPKLHIDGTDSGDAGNAGNAGNVGEVEVPQEDPADSDRSTSRSSSVMSGVSNLTCSTEPGDICEPAKFFTVGDFSVGIPPVKSPTMLPPTPASYLTEDDYSFTDYVVKVGHGSGPTLPVGLVIDTTTRHVEAAITVEMYNEWTRKRLEDGDYLIRSPLQDHLSKTLDCVHPTLMYYIF